MASLIEHPIDLCICGCILFNLYDACTCMCVHFFVIICIKLVCTLNALSNANSPMESNLFFLRSKYEINFQPHSLAHYSSHHSRKTR